MNRLCERASMKRNRRFVRTGMSAAQIGECPEADIAAVTPCRDGRLSLGRFDRAVAIEECSMLLFIHAGRVHVG
ncbi:hypothetical protein AWB69_02643 [Caballeronia udeis]|uniref:Uncharacterized protein n=1 Tax=Caballeronia udeis TaxID=1232866 RepID=A0A158GH52_9BURK|nr:hypothetical protein AWB69_02643 [Caballeronia udeis]